MATRSKYGGNFCSSSEHQITSIGSGYIANFLSGAGAEQAGATLTNKLIYFSGTVFSLNDKGQLTSIKQRKIVNVRDITGVGYIQYNPIQYGVYGVIALIVGIIIFASTGSTTGQGVWDSSSIGNGSIGIGIVVFIVMFALYSLYSKILLAIEYAGGNIAFDVRWFDPNEGGNFIRNIHLAKDKLYSMTATDQGFINEDSDDEVDEDEETAESDDGFFTYPRCGNEIKLDINFCTHCGEAVKGYYATKKMGRWFK